MTHNEELAAYFEVDPALAPLIPALLADLWDIGCDPDWVVQALAAHGIGSDHRVLDLGCGKGAAAVAVAEQLGAHVVGIDLHPGFVAVGQREVERRGLSALVTLRCGDIRTTVQQAQDYDAILLLAVGDVLGNLEATMGQLRRCVRPGGLMVIDDAYADDAQTLSLDSYHYLLPHAETLRQLTAWGDVLVAERAWTPEAIRAQNERYMIQIDARADAMIRQHPHLAPHIQAYLAREYEECTLLESTDVQCAMWVLRKHDG